MTRINITNAEISDALSRSGYLQEVRLERMLRGKGYYVQTNSALEDPVTKKFRELDIYALNAYKAGSEDDFLFPVLLIECVNNPQPLAVFPKKVLWRDAFAKEIRFSGLPVKIPVKHERNSWIYISDYLNLYKYHHYCRGAISSQFCSFTQKQNQGQWMASHDDTHFESIQKLCLAVDYYAAEHFRSWKPDPANEAVNLQVYYPVLILQGKLVEVIETSKGVTTRDSKYAHLVRTTLSGGKETTYHIDVVTESYFNKYLLLVKSETRKMARTLSQDRKIVRIAIDRISKVISKLRNSEKIQKAMEFSSAA